MNIWWIAAIGSISAIAAVGSYFWSTTPQQRELISLGMSIYYDRIKHILGPEEDPLIVNVDITLFYRNKKGKSEAATLENATREFIRLFKDKKTLCEYNFEKLIRSRDGKNKPYFSNVPDYSLLLNGEIIIRYRHFPSTENIYAVSFTHPQSIVFPLYSNTSRETPKLCFHRKIVQAYIGKKKTPPDYQQDIDISKTIIEFSGPNSDFYRHINLPPTPITRMLMTSVWDDGRYLKLTDSFGIHYIYDLKKTDVIQWPHDSPLVKFSLNNFQLSS